MSDAFSFVYDAEPLKAIKAHMKTITLLIQQVTECGYFIAEYSKQKSFCESSLTSSRHDTDRTSRDPSSEVHDLRHRRKGRQLREQAARTQERIPRASDSADWGYRRSHDECRGANRLVIPVLLRSRYSRFTTSGNCRLE